MKQSEKLRIGYVLWDFPALSQTFVINEIRWFVQNGFNIRVYYKTAPDKSAVIDFPLEVFRVDDSRQLTDLLKEHGCNILHSHFLYPAATLLTQPASQISGIPFTFIAHAVDIFLHNNRQRNRLVEVSTAELCRHVFAPGDFHRQFFLENGVPAEKIVWNPNSIDFDYFRLESFFDRPRKNAICCICRFVEKKGLAYLVRAARYLRTMPVVIDIYGYGPLQEKIQQLIMEEGADNVRLLGALPDRHTQKLVMQEYDLLVQPCVVAENGDMDGKPAIILEAMAACLPVLTTPVSSIPDLIRPHISGLLCQPRDEKDLAEKIHDFYEMPPGEIDYLTQNAQDLVREHYQVHDVCRTYARLWSEDAIDIFLVPVVNNAAELALLQEIVARVFRFTSCPFRLLIIDNGCDQQCRDYFVRLLTQHKNILLIRLDETISLGRASNMVLARCQSEYVFYLCSRECFLLRHNWEWACLRYMEEHPRVAIAGHMVYSPRYFNGASYQQLECFAKFRNPEFARANPDRMLGHVQGGFLVLRRQAFAELGGFNLEQDWMDVEYSYYLESMGWELGNIPQVCSLHRKTRPTLDAICDEQTLVAHPLTLANVADFDHLVNGAVKKCNICGWHGPDFNREEPAAAICPHCGSHGYHRKLFRFLAEATQYLYRKLPCLDLTPHSCWQEVLAKMFVYHSKVEIGINNRYDLILCLLAEEKTALPPWNIQNVADLLKPQGKALLHLPYGGKIPSPSLAHFLGEGDAAMTHQTVEKCLKARGFAVQGLKYASAAIAFDWRYLFVCTKT